jgi:hypothetical protein
MFGGSGQRQIFMDTGGNSSIYDCDNHLIDNHQKAGRENE